MTARRPPLGTNGLFGRLGIDVASGPVDNTGKVVQRFLTKAGKTLFYREPEGMMVYQTVGGHMRLCFGFVSRPSMTSSTRYASVYYKDVLI